MEIEYGFGVEFRRSKAGIGDASTKMQRLFAEFDQVSWDVPLPVNHAIAIPEGAEPERAKEVLQIHPAGKFGAPFHRHAATLKKHMFIV